MNRVEVTEKDGGPIRYDEAIRRLDERRSLQFPGRINGGGMETGRE